LTVLHVAAHDMMVLATDAVVPLPTRHFRCKNSPDRPQKDSTGLRTQRRNHYHWPRPLIRTHVVVRLLPRSPQVPDDPRSDLDLTAQCALAASPPPCYFRPGRKASREIPSVYRVCAMVWLLCCGNTACFMPLNITSCVGGP